MIRFSSLNLTAEKALLQFIVVKMGATLETGMEILTIIPDLIKTQSPLHQYEDLLRTLNTVKVLFCSLHALL